MWPTPNVTYANYTRPPIDPYVAPPPAPLGLESPPVPPPIPPIVQAPVQFLFNSLQECCNFEFPGQPCSMIDECPTPSPTPMITESYDPHCENGEIANGCEPVAVISAEKLRDLAEGAAETVAIANVLTNRPGISEYLIADEAWQCIWEELIPNGKGNRMVQDREGYVEEDYNFSAEMLSEMTVELDRLIGKYGSGEWTGKATANRLVSLLMEHRGYIQMELNDVLAGNRLLTDRDFLGPQERERRRRLRALEEGRSEDEAVMDIMEKKKHFEYFMELEQKVKEQRRLEEAKERQEEMKRNRRKAGR